MRTELARGFVLALALCACAPVAAPGAPPRDSGPRCMVDCPDVGPVVVRPDAGHDSGPMPDVGPVDAARFDGGDGGAPLQIVIDGVVNELVWPEPETLSVPPSDLFAGNHLDELSFFRDDYWLYIGIEGELVSGDRLVFYVDLGETGDDVNLSGFGLFDTTGAVDAMLSYPITTTGVDFRPELGWGTAAMPNTSSLGNDTIGWRRLSATGSFSLVSPGSRSACSASGCETAISLEAIGATRDSLVQFVVRLGQPGFAWSNQAFPTIDVSGPEFITDALVVPAAP